MCNLSSTGRATLASRRPSVGAKQTRWKENELNYLLKQLNAFHSGPTRHPTRFTPLPHSMAAAVKSAREVIWLLFARSLHAAVLGGWWEGRGWGVGRAASAACNNNAPLMHYFTASLQSGQRISALSVSPATSYLLGLHPVSKSFSCRSFC